MFNDILLALSPSEICRYAMDATVAQVALRSQCPTIGINRLFDFRCSSMFE